MRYSDGHLVISDENIDLDLEQLGLDLQAKEGQIWYILRSIMSLDPKLGRPIGYGDIPDALRSIERRYQGFQPETAWLIMQVMATAADKLVGGYYQAATIAKQIGYNKIARLLFAYDGSSKAVAEIALIYEIEEEFIRAIAFYLEAAESFWAKNEGIRLLQKGGGGPGDKWQKQAQRLKDKISTEDQQENTESTNAEMDLLHYQMEQEEPPQKEWWQFWR